MKYAVSVLYQDTFMEYHAKKVFWTSSFEEIEPKLTQVIDQVEKEIEASLLLEEGEEKESIIIKIFRYSRTGKRRLLTTNSSNYLT